MICYLVVWWKQIKRLLNIIWRYNLKWKDHQFGSQELQNARDQGLAKFNSARESGEKLYPNTSADGREGIRQELRLLQADWENYCDSLNDLQRHLETSLMQWSSYEDGYENLLKWIQDMEYSLKSDMELKTTLQEKKTMLQQCRVCAVCVQSVTRWKHWFTTLSHMIIINMIFQ